MGRIRGLTSSQEPCNVVRTSRKERYYMGIESKLLVLKLNRHWMPIDQSLVGDALVDLCAGINSYALDIDYSIKDNGEVDFSNPTVTRPVAWEEWITLKIRPWDFSIKSIKMEIRIPTILIAKNYDKMPMVKFGKTPSGDQVRIRDGNTCQYTGRKLSKNDISIDHVLAKSRGGKNTWENLVVTSKDINSRKGNSLNEEIGLNLIRQPKPPVPIPRYKLIREAKHPDWNLFLKSDDD